MLRTVRSARVGRRHEIALAAAATGAAVQLVGRIGDDATADAVILDLARGGVGHVALLRDPVRPTPFEPLDEAMADIDRPDDEPGPVPGDSGRGASPGEDGSGLEAADVDLGLRYLTEFAVVVLVGPAGSEIVTTAVEADIVGGCPAGGRRGRRGNAAGGPARRRGRVRGAR